MSSTAALQALLEPVLASSGVELDDLELASGVVKVIVDRPGGVDLDTISDLTHRISTILDEHDPFPGRSYALEVSSPGLERRLRTPAHFRRAVGTAVSVRTVAGTEGDRRAQGSLAAADDTGIEIDGRRILYTDIDRAHTVFEWGPPPKPGKVGARKKTQKATTQKAEAS
jgi:ribosome maturation factor RimP